MAKQIIIIGKPKNKEPKYLAIRKTSIGVAHINGVTYTFNPDKILTNRIEFDDAVNGIDTKKAKKKIYIRRK